MKALCILCALSALFINSTTAQNLQTPITKVEDIRAHIYNDISPDLKESKSWNRKCLDYSHSNAVGINKLIYSGNIFLEWPELEGYLNKVMQKILPEELKKDTSIHAYIINDGGYNAFMTASGAMFVQLGLIAEMPDEAGLAGVLAHEVAHYYKNHSLNRFILQEKGEFRNLLIHDPVSSTFSINNEYESDSLAIAWTQKAGYSLKGLSGVKEFEELLEAKRLALSEDKLEFKETTHPHSSKRREKLKNYIQKHPETITETNYLVDEEQFKNLKDKCRKAALENLLSKYKYSSLIEKGFKYHVLDPNNLDYIYYILEGIRRKCYLDYNYWNDDFITHRYFVEVEDSYGRKEKVAMEQLFTNLHPEVVGLTEEEKVNMRCGFYWRGKPRFVSNEQAFVFFYGLAKNFGVNEAILSNALSLSHSKAHMNVALEEYLALPDIKYRQFAKTLLEDTVFKSLKHKKLYVLNRHEVFVRQGKDGIRISPKAGDIESIKSLCDSILKKEPLAQFITMDDLREIDIESYRKLKQMDDFCYVGLLSVGKAQLHLLDPEFWVIFRNYGVNEIEFINFRYLEVRSSERTYEAYNEVANASMQDILNQNKRARSLIISFANLRIKKDAHMKLDYGLEYDLSFKRTGKMELSTLLNEHLQAKKMYDYRSDLRYKDSLKD